MIDQLKRALDMASMLGRATGPRRRYTEGAFGDGRRESAQRLKPATGPGSINELNEMGALVRAQKWSEAKDYYQRCLNINYRKGKPKLHPRMVGWYQQIVVGQL